MDLYLFLYFTFFLLVEHVCVASRRYSSSVGGQWMRESDALVKSQSNTKCLSSILPFRDTTSPQPRGAPSYCNNIVSFSADVIVSNALQQVSFSCRFQSNFEAVYTVRTAGTVQRDSKSIYVRRTRFTLVLEQNCATVHKQDILIRGTCIHRNTNTYLLQIYLYIRISYLYIGFYTIF